MAQIYIKYRSGYKYQLVEEYEVKVSVTPKNDIKTDFIELSTDGMLVLKNEYAWDGPSGPTIDTPDFMRGSLVHDALYQLMRMGLLGRDNKDSADRALQKICIEDGMMKMRAWWVYRGVKLGGNPSTDPKNRKEIIQVP